MKKGLKRLQYSSHSTVLWVNQTTCWQLCQVNEGGRKGNNRLGYMHLANFITRFNEGDAIGNFMACAKWKRLCFILTSVWLSVANLSFSSKSFALNTKVLNYHALSYFKELRVLYYLFRALPLWVFFLNWHSLQLSVSSPLEPAWSWDLQFGLDQVTPNDSVLMVL